MGILLLILAVSAVGPIIGSLIGVLRRPSQRFILFLLAFAAGVMLAISFLELLPESLRLASVALVILGIITGSLMMMIIERTLPHFHPQLNQDKKDCDLTRTAWYLLIGIFMHNLPEGMAIASGAVTDDATVLTLAIAISIHNIPEGICTSAPYYYCTKKRMKSFLLSSLTALPIIVGFLLAYVLFKNLPESIVGFFIAATAGVMIFISADELIPTACMKGNKEWSGGAIVSLILGVIFVVALTSLGGG